MLAAQIWTGLVPMTLHVTPDGRVLVAMGVIAAAAAVVITSVPAFIITRRIGFHAQLRERRAHNRALGNIGRVLIAAQVTLSVALLFTNVLLVRTLVNVRRRFRVPDQWRRARQTGRPPRRLPEPRRDDVLPGARRASGRIGRRQFSGLARGFGAPATDPRPVARSESAGEPAEVASVMDAVSPGFFQTLQIPLIQGRDFMWHDDVTIGPVAIINRSLQERLFPTATQSAGASGLAPSQAGGGWRSSESSATSGTAHRVPAGPAIYRPWLQERPTIANGARAR